jgi:hypothetical protein
MYTVSPSTQRERSLDFPCPASIKMGCEEFAGGDRNFKDE